MGRSSGVVLMAPPHESQEAAASVSTLLSTLKPKQKVGQALQTGTPLADCLRNVLPQTVSESLALRQRIRTSAVMSVIIAKGSCALLCLQSTAHVRWSCTSGLALEMPNYVKCSQRYRCASELLSRFRALAPCSVLCAKDRTS